MTPNKEDYLKAIYKLGGMEEQVSNKQIAESLQIAPASVTEMLGKLKREGLIHYEPYKGSRLTDAGMRIAITLVRGHRLWEVFLMRHLGYSWSEAHEDAELLDYLQASGIIIGSAVRIVEAGAYEGPLTLDLEGKQVQISYKAACHIYVDETARL